jgi:hypothetical protein
MNCKVKLFEDGKESPFNFLSGNEVQSISDLIKEQFHDGDNELFILKDDIEQSYGMLYNVDEMKIKQFLNKKIQINPQQYGVNPWGKVEIYFEKFLSEIDQAIHLIESKEERPKKNLFKKDHHKKEHSKKKSNDKSKIEVTNSSNQDELSNRDLSSINRSIVSQTDKSNLTESIVDVTKEDQSDVVESKEDKFNVDESNVVESNVVESNVVESNVDESNVVESNVV